MIRGSRQTITVILTFRKCNKSSAERPASVYRPSSKRNTLYFRHQSNIRVSTSNARKCYSLTHSTGLNNKPRRLANAPNNEVDTLRNIHFIIWRSSTQKLQAVRRYWCILFIPLLKFFVRNAQGLTLAFNEVCLK